MKKLGYRILLIFLGFGVTYLGTAYILNDYNPNTWSSSIRGLHVLFYGMTQMLGNMYISLEIEDK